MIIIILLKRNISKAIIFSSVSVTRRWVDPNRISPGSLCVRGILHSTAKRVDFELFNYRQACKIQRGTEPPGKPRRIVRNSIKSII